MLSQVRGMESGTRNMSHGFIHEPTSRGAKSAFWLTGPCLPRLDYWLFAHQGIDLNIDAESICELY